MKSDRTLAIQISKNKTDHDRRKPKVMKTGQSNPKFHHV